MNENTTRSADRELLHRIDVRRRQLGLTEAELAERVGMSPLYFRHLLDLGTDFSPSGFLHIATALGMTYQELVEGRTDAPPGQPGASAHPVLMRLTADECWELLGTHGIGRIALPVHPGPSVFPVNYLVDGDTVVYRTDPAGAAVAEPGGEVSFQVDHIDEHRRDGWSVLIVGTAEHVTDTASNQRLAEQPGCEPWAGGVRSLWIRVIPAKVSGRRIHGL
ncbi:pyridoxamine 5'-phosphate oxidase family protein [Kitasatospora sp. NPDC050463]|uniref:pyridoxamine 5'-phosphate oxidase family protein n=1 Tax=Kitasatospora sp. NPDC050463 TaxID=3155786 RepID=UPI0033D6F3EA